MKVSKKFSEQISCLMHSFQQRQIGKLSYRIDWGTCKCCFKLKWLDFRSWKDIMCIMDLMFAHITFELLFMGFAWYSVIYIRKIFCPNYLTDYLKSIGHMPIKVWDEINSPFPNFNGCTVEVWEWIINFSTHFIMDVITFPCWGVIKSILGKGAKVICDRELYHVS